jgi:enoyl-CoA hydratase
VADAAVVVVEVIDRVATITLNRPEARNALSRELRAALPAVVAGADADDGVDVLILTGADPAFCAGLDLKELGAGGGGGVEGEVARRGPLPATSKPLIGAINGVAITGGFELALACDFLVASERARFADTHSRVGIMPGWGLTVLLPQAVGVRRARELSATGNFLDAETALAWGLVNHVVPHDHLLPFARELAADIVSNDQGAVRQIYATYDEGSLGTAQAGWDVEQRVARSWRGGHLDAEEIERRRQAIVDRGRSQL